MTHKWRETERLTLINIVVKDRGRRGDEELGRKRQKDNERRKNDGGKEARRQLVRVGDLCHTCIWR